ncbi:MAG: hypothetical protein ABRQ37_19065, partial [Candidatus Eremiobacterota bacterium]
MEEWIKKLEKAIESSDDKTIKDEILSLEQRDEIYREEFRRKIPQILMVLWSKMEFDEFIEFLKRDFFSRDDRSSFISRIAPSLDSTELNKLRDINNENAVLLPPSPVITDDIMLIDKKIMEFKTNFTENSDLTPDEREIIDLLSDFSRQAEYGREEYLINLLRKFSLIKNDNLIVKIIEIFILHFNLDWQELLIYSLKNRNNIHDFSKKPVINREDIFYILSGIISGLKREVFFGIIWLFRISDDYRSYRYHKDHWNRQEGDYKGYILDELLHHTEPFLNLIMKEMRELVHCSDPFLDKSLIDMIEAVIKDGESSKRADKEKDYRYGNEPIKPGELKMEYLITLLFRRNSPGNREYLIKLFEKISDEGEFYPEIKLLIHFFTENLDEEHFRIIGNFLKKQNLELFFSKYHRSFYNTFDFFKKTGFIYLLSSLPEAESNKKRFEILREISNKYAVPLPDECNIKPEFFRNYTESLNRDKWSSVCRVFAEEVLSYYSKDKVHFNYIEEIVRNTVRFFYWFHNRDIGIIIFMVSFYLSIFLLVPQFIIGIFYLICGCSLPIMWFIAEEKVTAFFSLLIL